MKLLCTEISPLINSSFFIEKRERDFFSSPFHTQPSFHSHPELELVYIMEGYGKRIIGNKVESFNSGDMVFIGSNVPHIWLSDETFYKENSILYSKSIVSYIHPKIFKEVFTHIEELSSIKNMIERASRGIRIIGETRDKIAERLQTCVAKTGFEKFNEFLTILYLISISEETTHIIDEESASIKNAHSDRLIEVIKYIKDNFSEPISLKEVSKIACMTEQSFCRYFKNRTQKSFSEYLLNLRMSHACQLLISVDKSISDIAFSCGYRSTSHFCQVFKDEIGVTPHQYKVSFFKNLSLPA